LSASTPHDFMAAILGPPSQLSPTSLTALGFVVVGVDARGTPNRSKAFLDYSYGRWSMMGIEDHVAAIKELGRRLRYLDLKRVGIVGWSFGGESAIRAMLEFPDFFKVAVAEDPAGGQHNMYTGTEPWVGVPIYSDGSSLRPKPNEIAKNFATFDSGEQAARLKGHLLVMVAELDQNVFAASTLQFTDALMKANKNFDLIFSPNAAHFVTYAKFPDYQAYLRRRGRDYFIVHLLGAALPAQPGTDFK
jgi:dipeptidyl-peptidase-4